MTMLRQLFVILVATAAAFAQQSDALVSGTVTDSTGAIVPDVSVSITNANTGVQTSMKSNASGIFISPSLQPGEYQIAAERSGFKKFLLTGVTLSTGDRVNVNVTLTVGNLAESVEVTADSTPLLEYGNANISRAITGSAVQQLPLINRDALSLVSTTAGANAENINGAQRNGLNISMDGINIQDLRTNFGLTTPMFTSVDRVGEVQVLTSPADAEVGRGVGHIVITSRGGTNQLHGSLFEQLRNTALNANSYFNNLNGLPRNVLIRNQFGGSIDGPVRRDRTFFRFHIESQRLSQQNTVTSNVFTASARQGLFRFFPGVQNGNAQASVPTVDANGEPLRPSAATGALQSVSLYGKDPARFTADPTGAVQKALSVMPMPNNFRVGDGLNTAGYTWQRNSPFPRTQWDFRIDHYFTAANRLAINYTHENSDNPNGNQATPFPTIPGGTLTSKIRVLSLNLSSTLRPNLINELRGGFNRPDQQYLAPWDLQGTSYLPTISGVPYQLGLSQATSPYGNNNNPTAQIGPYGRITPVYQIADNITWLNGRHTWKTGFEYWNVISNGFNAFNVMPRVNVGNGIAGAPLNITTITGIGANGTLAQNMLNDLAGSVDSITQAFNIDGPTNPKYLPGLTKQRTWQSQEYTWFLKDDFKVSSSLTLNIGVRYEYYRPVYDANGRGAALVGGSKSIFGISGTDWGSLFKPGANSGALTKLELVDGKSPNPDKRIYSPDRNNFSPAVGVSWKLPTGRLLGNRSVMLRTGYGWTYQKIAPRHIDDAAGSQPNISFVNVYRATTPVDLRSSTLPHLPLDPPLSVAPLTDRSQILRGIDDNLRQPYVQSWNFGLETAVTGNSSFRVSYVGTKGTRIYGSTNINETNVFENGILDAFRLTQTGGNAPLMNTLFQGLNVPGVGVVNSSTITGSDAVRRNPTMNAFLAANDVGGFANFLNTNNFITGQIGGIPRRAGFPENWITVNPQFLTANYTANLSSSIYHSMQVEFTKRYSSGLSLNANYTMAKVFGDDEGNQSSENNIAFPTLRDRSTARRLMNFSIAHVVNMTGSYELPFGGKHAILNKSSHSWLSKIVEGWQTGWVVSMQSGQPLGITVAGNTFNNNGLATGVPLADIPRSLGNTTKVGNGVTYFDGFKLGTDPVIQTYSADFRSRSTLRSVVDASGKTILINPTVGTLGALDLRPLVGPGIFNLDLNLIRTFAIKEKINFQLRADANSVTNSPQWGNPNLNINTPAFGNITSANGNRIVTVQGRITF